MTRSISALFSISFFCSHDFSLQNNPSFSSASIIISLLSTVSSSSHEIELPQEFPSTEEDDTVDNKEMMMDAEENEGLFCKEKSCEQKKEIENKAEIDRVIDEICALFNKKELRRIWTPQYLYLKFMEFLPNQRKKTDDVISVSFWPP
ncbi:hypothetical protein QL285_001550 [Trifolium repens]|nr:hypothetical protein QL285_001550 [Trifolium repens]